MDNLPSTQITRQNLIDAFWQLYCKKSIEKITVTEVCKIAGYNRSTFYVYFKDVYEILEEIENNTIKVNEFKDAIVAQLLTHKTLTKKEILEHIIHLYENNKTYLPVLLGENGDPHFRHKILQKFAPIILSTFRELTEKEKIKVEYIMEYQSAAVLNTISKWYNKDKDIPLEEFIDLLIMVTSSGVQKELLKFKTD